MIKQSLNQKMLQRLSPQQIQLMKILQIPTASLDQRIKEELEANPALDEGDQEQDEDPYDTNRNDEQSSEDDYEKEDVPEQSEEGFELDEYLEGYIEDDPSSYKSNYDNTYNPDEEDKTIPVIVEVSYHQNLERQLGMLNLKNEKEKTIGLQIIGNIDNDGYLRRDIESIIDDLAFYQNITTTEDEMLHWLKEVQSFEPAGSGARNLRECLLIQLLKRYEAETNVQTKMSIKIAIRLIENYFDEFTKKHYKKLQRSLGITEDQLRDANDEILKLNPKPASGYSSGSRRDQQYIVPDFELVTENGELKVELNSRNAPELHVNNHYQSLLSNYKKKFEGRRPDKQSKDAVTFIKQKIDSARWFIDAISQRQRTMLKTMSAIFNFQRDYFETGDEKRLRPMILKDIAQITGLDISTVSRVANSKFIQTEFGIKRLKDFFSESLQTENGEEVSTLEVKKILTEIIDAESKKKPLSDEKLKNMLQDKGYNIARRTVAKYREQLNIPVARLRKSI